MDTHELDTTAVCEILIGHPSTGAECERGRMHGVEGLRYGGIWLVVDRGDVAPADGNAIDHLGFRTKDIKAKIGETEGDDWAYNEGCLSIPKIREDVYRPEKLTIEYMDENFQHHKRTFHGITARVIFHEYDHIEGKLFIDYLKPLKKRMIKGRLEDITKGKVRVDYKMSFPK